MDIIKAFLAICELVFAGSIVYVRLADPNKSGEFFEDHKILGFAWVSMAIIGFGTFFVTGILKISI